MYFIQCFRYDLSSGLRACIGITNNEPRAVAQFGNSEVWALLIAPGGPP